MRLVTKAVHCDTNLNEENVRLLTDSPLVSLTEAITYYTRFKKHECFTYNRITPSSLAPFKYLFHVKQLK